MPSGSFADKSEPELIPLYTASSFLLRPVFGKVDAHQDSWGREGEKDLQESVSSSCYAVLGREPGSSGLGADHLSKQDHLTGLLVTVIPACAK